MVLQATLNGLADPQGAVGRELEPATPVELLHGTDEAEHALLDEILHGQAVALIATGLGDHEAQVRIDHPLLGLPIHPLDPLGQLDLFSGGQQRVSAGATQEQIE